MGGVQQALDRYRDEGDFSTILFYNDPASASGSWYVFIASRDGGTIVAHPTLPDHVGMSLLGPLGTDSAGNEFGSAILGAPTNGRWVSYQHTNLAIGEAGMKHTWVVARDQLVFGSGWYE